MSYIDDNASRQQVAEFAWACVEKNSLSELIDAKKYESDSMDMIAWAITASEWREAISLAIRELQEQD